MKLWRLIASGCIMVGVLGLSVGTSVGAPTNSKTTYEITGDCGGDGTIHLRVSGGGGAMAFEVGENGRAYELRTIEGRVYKGDVDPEPSVGLLYAFERNYGLRIGFSRTLWCTARRVETEGGVVITNFFDVVLAAK